MNKEVLFAQTLEQVRKTAKEQGNCISEEQVKDAFAELDLSGEQLQMVFDYLLKHKIGIGQPMDPDEFLTDEEKDYLQEYLDEVAELPTYTDGEKLAFSMSAMAGEADAQQRLIEIHLADVAEIAKLYAGQGVLLEDLVGEGNLALSFGVTMLGSLEKPQEVEGMLGKMIMDAMDRRACGEFQDRQAGGRQSQQGGGQSQRTGGGIATQGDHRGTDGGDRHVPQNDRGCGADERFQD